MTGLSLDQPSHVLVISGYITHYLKNQWLKQQIFIISQFMGSGTWAWFHNVFLVRISYKAASRCWPGLQSSIISAQPGEGSNLRFSLVVGSQHHFPMMGLPIARLFPTEQGIRKNERVLVNSLKQHPKLSYNWLLPYLSNLLTAQQQTLKFPQSIVFISSPGHQFYKERTLRVLFTYISQCIFNSLWHIVSKPSVNIQ